MWPGSYSEVRWKIDYYDLYKVLAQQMLMLHEQTCTSCLQLWLSLLRVQWTPMVYTCSLFYILSAYHQYMSASAHHWTSGQYAMYMYFLFSGWRQEITMITMMLLSIEIACLLLRSVKVSITSNSSNFTHWLWSLPVLLEKHAKLGHLGFSLLITGSCPLFA